MKALATIVIGCLALIGAAVRLCRNIDPDCDECGQPLGTTDTCDSCIDWRCYP